MTTRHAIIRPEARELDFFRRNERWLFSLVCVIAILPFFGLGHTDLEGDEGMWALRGKAIAEHDVWLDQTDYAVKGLYSGAYPPAYFWSMGAAMKLFGVGPASARLPSAFFGFATVILIFYIARKTYGFRPAVLAAIIFGLGHKYIDYAQTAEMDIAYAFWVVLAIYLYMRYQRGSGRALAILPMAGMATGMAFLTKPLLGLYVPFILLPYLLYMAAFQRYGWKRALLDLLVLALGAAAVATWWHSIMIGLHPAPKGFWYWLVERNILQRQASAMEGHSSGWGPLYYANALVIYFPFVFAVGVVGLAETCRMLAHKMFYRPHSFPGTAAGTVNRVLLSVEDRMRLLILVWLVVTFLVPTTFASKIAKYGILMMVPFSILAGAAVDRVYRGATSRETNIVLFAWTATSVVYWQTHKAQHALEGLARCLWDWQAPGAGEMALLADGGALGLARVAGAGVVALALGVVAWSLRNLLSVRHESVGRLVLPVTLGPMLVIALWQVAIPPGVAHDDRPDPRGAESAFSAGRDATDAPFEMAPHVVVLGHWKDNFQMAFYTNSINYPPNGWREPLAHTCQRSGETNTIPELVRIEHHGGRWLRYDLGFEKSPGPTADPYDEVEEIVTRLQEAREPLLLVVVTHDKQLRAERDRVQAFLSRIIGGYNAQELHADEQGVGYTLLYLAWQ